MFETYYILWKKNGLILREREQHPREWFKQISKIKIHTHPKTDTLQKLTVPKNKIKLRPFESFAKRIPKKLLIKHTSGMILWASTTSSKFWNWFCGSLMMFSVGISGGILTCGECGQRGVMGNKLSCSCAPLIRKAYRYEDGPFQSSRRRDGHLLRWIWPF